MNLLIQERFMSVNVDNLNFQIVRNSEYGR